MEVSKLPPNVPTARTASAPAAEQGTQLPATIAPPADRADIRPLDIPGALQILLAEVRAELDQLLEAAFTARGPGAGGQPSGAPTSGGLSAAGPGALAPLQAARELVEMLLQAVPDDAGDVSAWTGALVRAEDAIQSGIDRAMGVVTQWRDAPAAVVDAVRETRVLFSAALADDAENPLWLRPEWMGLSPLFHRFRRRRRTARRRLSDPDFLPQSLDDDEGFRR